MKLEIIINEDGSVTLNGPIDNPLLCYGIIKLGEVTLTQYTNSKQQGKGIVKPTPFDLNRIKQ